MSKQCTCSWSETASASITQSVTGSHQFKIVGYSLLNEMAIGTCISSATFTIDGYNWIIRFYPKGYSQNSAYMAAHLELRSEAENLNVAIEFAVHDNAGTLSFKNKIVHTFSSPGSIGAVSNFIDMNTFAANLVKYVKDDCLIIGCTVCILKPFRVPCSIVVPPSEFCEQFGVLFASKDGTDVTFEVNGQTFNAHRCVLAARSCVFKAALFGEMEEKDKKEIKIAEMEAPVFKAMLHFIYNDSLPDLTKSVDGSKHDSTYMAQHLLVAADRYALERLKILCAEMLYRNIEESNVASMIALAVQHNCLQLKDACLEFIATPKTLKALMQADGFKYLIRTSPSILKDLGEKKFGSG